MQQENQLHANGMENLHREIVLDILSRLPITSQLQSRFVCRAWHKLTFDRNLVNLHLSQAAVSRDPFLIFHCEYTIRNQLYFVELSDLNDGKQRLQKIHTPFCASMQEFRVVGSCNGLLCLCDSSNNNAVFIFNPFTRDYKQLRRSVTYDKEHMVEFEFGYHPMINEYKVVKIIFYWNMYNLESEVQVLSLRTNAWKSIGKLPHHLERQSPKAVSLNGRFHWISRSRTRPDRYDCI